MLGVLLLAGCGGASTGQQGEIAGIIAQVPFEELQSGGIKNLEYTGTVVVLAPDNEEVIVNCPDEFLSDITEAVSGQFTYSIDGIVLDTTWGVFIATIIINPEEHQDVLFTLNEAGEWEIIKVLK